MLVLSRKEGECIIINHDVILRVDGIYSRTEIHLTFEAPAVYTFALSEHCNGALGSHICEPAEREDDEPKPPLSFVRGRPPFDKVLIGSDIVVTFVDIQSSGARIGIDAPREILVHREEVYRDMQDRWMRDLEFGQTVFWSEPGSDQPTLFSGTLVDWVFGPLYLGEITSVKQCKSPDSSEPKVWTPYSPRQEINPVRLALAAEEA